MPQAPAHAVLRQFHAGVLSRDEFAASARHVIEPATGELILAAASAARGAVGSATLHVPEERESALQILVAVSPLDPESLPAFRWRVYHGEPARFGLGVWLRARAESARLGAWVGEPESLELINPFHAGEPEMCRVLNREFAGGGSMLIVGIDDRGLDLRASRRVERIEFPSRAGTPDEALALGRRAIAERGSR